MNHPRHDIVDRNRRYPRLQDADGVLEFTGREAVSDRVKLGRPEPEPGWHAIGLAMKRYEPTISMFAVDRWSAEDLWMSAIGGGGVPLDLTASMVLAIIDCGMLHAIKRLRRKYHWSGFIDQPMWALGHRTKLGAEYDSAMRGLNIMSWKSGLARSFHRRYSRVHG